MLSAPDLELVGRDQALPGLATVLDPEKMVRVLQRFRPDAEGPAAIDYVRYKPATSCLVGYRLALGGSELLLAVHARRADSAQKLAKVSEKVGVESPLGSGYLLIPELALSVSVFPNDLRLKGLKRIGDPAKRSTLLRKLLSSRTVTAKRFEVIRYRPARRCVVRATDTEGRSLLVKFYLKSDFGLARKRAVAFQSAGELSVPSLLGASEGHFALGSEWLAGAPFRVCREDSERVGRALLRLHQQAPARLPVLTRSMQSRSAQVLADDLGRLWPPLAERCRRLADAISAALSQHDSRLTAIHGDFYADQVLVPEEGAQFIDFDEAVWGSPAWDVGNFSAHLAFRTLSGHVDEPIETCTESLLASYRAAGGEASTAEVRSQTALGLLRLAPRPFRERHFNWPERIETILSCAEQFLPAASSPLSNRAEVPTDPKLPLLGKALEPTEAATHFRLSGDIVTCTVESAKLVRHKVGRGCLIEYAVGDAAGNRVTLLGKMRARGVDQRSYEVQRHLWETNFGADAVDRVVLAEPVAIVPSLSLWLQRKIPGKPVTCLLEGGEVPDPRLVATAIAKLHDATVPLSRRWTLEQELDLLRDRLEQFRMAQPGLGDRLSRLIQNCEDLAQAAAPVGQKMIHRDFHPENILIDKPAAALIDLDLLCYGDPAVDLGNFLAHITELGLRRWGEPDRFVHWQQDLVKAYCSICGSTPNISIYEMLTLVRLTEISTRMADRRPTTAAMLELCELKLQEALFAVGELT